MGCSDDGNDPVALAQTGCPCARVPGSDHDFVSLVVPGGASIEACFDLIGGRTSDRAGPVSVIESVDGSGVKCSLSAQAGCEAEVCPMAIGGLIYAESGQPNGLVLGFR